MPEKPSAKDDTAELLSLAPKSSNSYDYDVVARILE
jgi:hypothetical protein